MPLTEEERQKIEEEEKYRAELRTQYQPPPVTNGKNLSIAYVLNFIIPGLGHVYLGQVGKGIIIFLVASAGISLAGVPTILAWLYGLLDTKPAYLDTVGEVAVSSSCSVLIVILAIIVGIIILGGAYFMAAG